MRRVARVLGGIALLVGGMSQVQAHAFLDHAVPAVGSAVHGSPREVSVWFTEELEPAFSSVRVVDRSGKRVDKGDKEVTGPDRRVLRVSLQPLAPGTYRVFWLALSLDAHVTEGDHRFEVLP